MEAEQAVIDDERNLYKDGMEWGCFQLPLDNECYEKIESVEFFAGGSDGDSVLIKLKVVKDNVYVAKTKASVYKPVHLPEQL